MRTTLSLDDDLVDKAERLTGTREKTALVREALRALIERESARRLIDEKWRATAVAAVHRCRESDPQGWSEYLAEADDMTGADAPIGDEWADNPG